MTVSIDVDINARSAHVKLGALKAQIKELDDNLDFDVGDLDFDLDLGDTIDDLSDAMDEISESFNSDLNETIDRLDGLEFDDINLRGRGDSSGDTGGDSGDPNVDVDKKRDIDRDSITVDLDDSLKSLNNALESFSESLGDNLDKKIDRMSDIEFDHNVDIKGEIGDKSQDNDDYIPSPRQFVKDSIFDDDPNDPQAASVRMFEKKAGILSDIFDVDQYDDDLKNRHKRYDSKDSLPVFSEREAVRNTLEEVSGFDTIADRGGTRYFTPGKGNFYQDSFGTRGLGNSDLDRLKDLRADIQTSAYEKHDFKFGSTMPGDQDGIGMKGAFPLLSGDTSGRDGTNWKRELKNIYSGVDKATDSFKNAIPSMRTWFNLLAVSIPALAAVAVQALGVATAFGAIAVAGAGMVGLGLLGHGDSMAESMRNAKEEVNELKQNLFETFEPSMDLFGGVQTRFFDAVPGMLEKVSRSLRGMLVFEDEFFDMFNQITKFIADFFNMISSNEETISDLWGNFKGILGTQVIKFFEWLLEAAHQNQKMLVDLGGVLKNVGLALYEVFVMVSRTLIMLSPFLNVVVWLTKALNNKFVSSLLATLAVLYLFTNVLPAIYAGFWSIGIALQRSTIPYLAKAALAMTGYITKALMAIGVNQALAASIATVTTALLALMAVSGIGLAIAGLGTLGMKAMSPGKTRGGVGAGPDGYGGSSGSKTIVNEGDTVNVDLSNADSSSVEKFKDMEGGGDLGATNGSYTSD